MADDKKTDSNELTELTGDLDLLGDWLDAKGYGEEAGLCTRVMDHMHKQDARIAELEAVLDKASAALSWLLLEGVDEVIPDTCPAEYKICVDALSAARAALEGK